MPEDSITDLYTKRQLQKSKETKPNKDKYYIELSDVKSIKGIIDLEIFSDIEEFESYLMTELRGIEPGIEMTIGKGKEGDKWFPQPVRDIITKEI